MNRFSYWVDIGPCPTSGIRRVKSAWAEGRAMPDLYLNGRPVYVEAAELAHVDSFIAVAIYADTLVDLNEKELDALNNSDSGQDYLVTENLEKHGYWED